MQVEHIIISKQGEDSENLLKFKEIIKNKNISVIVIGENNSNSPYRIYIENNLYFDIIWPNNKELILENKLNNNSIVCKLYYNFSMLFTGDIEEIAENQILQCYKDDLNILRSTILKVAHHGSNTSTTKEFLKAVKPKIALIGVGKNNKCGHPNLCVLERLEDIRM